MISWQDILNTEYEEVCPTEGTRRGNPEGLLRIVVTIANMTRITENDLCQTSMNAASHQPYYICSILVYCMRQAIDWFYDNDLWIVY